MKNLLCLLLPVFLTATSLFAQTRAPGKAGHRKHPGIQYGTASYYANKFQGRPTASGELYDKNKMTCAHNALPLGTWLKVTNLRNNRSVVVRVNDRLNYRNHRLVDLSKAAASHLGYVKRGLARVKVTVLGKKRPSSAG